MKTLLVLILCLLVNFRISSQEDTQKKVILTENQAKEVIKDLKRYDGLKIISALQEERLLNLEKKESIYQNLLGIKDSIITEQRSIINIKDEIINAKKPLEIHTYLGVESFQTEFINSGAYFRASLELKKINIGAKGVYRPNDIYNMPNLYYNIYVEFKIF